MSLFIKLLFFIVSLAGLVMGGCTIQPSSPIVAQDIKDPWWKVGKASLQQRLKVKPNTHQATNVILFIGDGMGISTITAARIFDGQSRGESGEENVLSFERFPHVALIKTYSVDAQVSDSASTASAINTGVKTRFLSIGMWGNQAYDDCFGPQKNFPLTLAEIAETVGMSTGVVTKDKVTYATPAAVYAHAPIRLWEDDANMPEKAREKGCKDIAEQLVTFPHGDGLDVVMGGGKESLLPVSKGGKRLDGQDLVETWQRRNPEGSYIQTAKELRSLDSIGKTTQKLLGLFSHKHMAYAVDRNIEEEPTLSEMTSTAIDTLAKNPKGYFLMVENGHIDHAHHATNAYRALSDTQEFAKAIETALEKVNLDDTLILVTADHSHPLTLGGFANRGNPILGLGQFLTLREDLIADNPFPPGLEISPYTTLGYHLGPIVRNAGANSLSESETTGKNYKQFATNPMMMGFHSGEDVSLYAIGPHSHLVGGVLEQNVIFHIISQALGWNN